MKIVHVCLAGSYTPDFTYHENLLPKYHKLAGHDVEIIAPANAFDEKGRQILADAPAHFTNEHAILVRRLAYQPTIVARRIRAFKRTFRALCEAEPQVIFVHGCQFIDVLLLVRYVQRHPGVFLYIDNHADFSNSARNWFSRLVMHGILWRMVAHLAAPQVARFYGVTPARVDFLVEVYKLPPDSVELLVMGADDEQVALSRAPEARGQFRSDWGIGPTDFLIVTGGKIDQAKGATLLLMEAVSRISDPRLRLIIFGSVAPELGDRFKALLKDTRIQYAGWVRGGESYRFFAAAELAAFPAGHSVYWEQAVGLGVPILAKHWPGLTHVDVGGNCTFLTTDTAQEIELAIRSVLEHPDRYKEMLRVAQGPGMKAFSYVRLAQRSIALTCPLVSEVHTPDSSIKGNMNDC